MALTLRSTVPALPVILTSGYPANAWSECDAADLRKLGSASVMVLQKPSAPKRLLYIIEELIGTGRAQAGTA